VSHTGIISESRGLESHLGSGWKHPCLSPGLFLSYYEWQAYQRPRIGLAKMGAGHWGIAVPILDAGQRLASPHGRIDLAREVIGVMFHPDDAHARKRRQAALAATLLGMKDGKTDEPDALDQARAWFKRAGGFKTESLADPYHKQQTAAVARVPHLLATGTVLHLVWAMDTHHRQQLAGGASLNKAIVVCCASGWAQMAERSVWKAWSRYKSVAHFCAAFALVFHGAREDLPDPDERVKVAFVEDLHRTLSLAAAYQAFAIVFRPRATEASLLCTKSIWELRGIEPDTRFVPPPLPPGMLAMAENYQAAPNIAYR
jgi:hypothetical protein